MTLKTGVMMLKIHLRYHRNKLHLKIYSNRQQLLKIVIIFHNITVFIASYATLDGIICIII